jgi:hypothetical protein
LLLKGKRLPNILPNYKKLNYCIQTYLMIKCNYKQSLSKVNKLTINWKNKIK